MPDGVIYASKQAITVQNVTSGAITGIGDVAVHVASYPGDVNASRNYTSVDGLLIFRLAAGVITDLPAYRNLDPKVIADITGDGRM